MSFHSKYNFSSFCLYFLSLSFSIVLVKDFTKQCEFYKFWSKQIKSSQEESLLNKYLPNLRNPIQHITAVEVAWFVTTNGLQVRDLFYNSSAA